jgi:hypothetical protein
VTVRMLGTETAHVYCAFCWLCFLYVYDKLTNQFDQLSLFVYHSVCLTGTASSSDTDEPTMPDCRTLLHDHRDEGAGDNKLDCPLR